MTSPKTLSKGKNPVARSYFCFLLKQNWPAFVTNTILFLLVNLVIYSMGLSEELRVVSEFDYTNILDLARAIRLVNCVVASLLSVLWGSVAMQYMNSKVSVHFYHSLPLTRGTLYIEEILVKVICLALPALVTNLLSICLTAVMSGFCTAEIVQIFLSSFGYAVLYFVFFFSVMIFCASFTGNTFARLMSAGMVVFMPAALISCAVSVFAYSARFSSYDHLLERALEWIVPVRAVFLLTEEITFGALEEFFTALGAIAFLIAGYVIYRYRKSELSGTPVLSRIAAALIKFSCMFCAAAIFGLVFSSFTNNAVWYAIGAVIGIFLSMMLLNVILTKSAKKMFVGLPAMGIFAAAFLGFYVLFGVDVIGYDRYVPSAASTATMTVQIAGAGEFPIEDEVDQEYLLDYLRDYMESANEERVNSRSVWVVEDSPASMTVETAIADDIMHDIMWADRYVDITVELGVRFGLPIEKYFYVPQSDMMDFLTRIANMEYFASYYYPSEMFENGLVQRAQLMRLQSEFVEDEAQVRAMLAYMREHYTGAEMFQKSTVSHLYCRVEDENGRRTTIQVPCFDDDPQYLNALIDQVSSVWVYSYAAGEWTEYTDASQIRQICENLAYETELTFRGCTSVFTRLDSDYGVALQLHVSGDEAEEEAWMEAVFLEGKVPAFIQ